MASLKYLWLFTLFALAAVTAMWPQLDIAVTRSFYHEGRFPAQQAVWANVIHDAATGWTPKILGGLLIAAVLLGLLLNRRVWPALYLLCVLLLGPGLLANLVLKDQWGRARPVQVREFGGTKPFTPYWQPGTACEKNCSFISGDGSFGFALPALALVWFRHRRLLFWIGTAAGLTFGITRIMMGAHFLSDTVWAALLMLGVMFGIYALFCGWAATRQAWRSL